MKISDFIFKRSTEILGSIFLVSVIIGLIIFMSDYQRKIDKVASQEDTIKKSYRIINLEGCEYIYHQASTPLVHKANCTNHLTHYKTEL